MWGKALIVFAAVSAIAADNNDDLSKKVNETLAEYWSLYPKVADASHTLAEILSSKLKNLTGESIKSLQDDFCYDDASTNVSALEAKAKELGKNISACLSLNNLNLLQKQEINTTTQALNEACSQSVDTIRKLVNSTLASIERNQHLRIVKYNRDIVHCYHHENVLAYKTCLWAVLTQIQIDEGVLQSRAASLTYSVVHDGLKTLKKINGIVGNHVAGWKKAVGAVVANITNCAEKVFNGNSTIEIELY